MTNQDHICCHYCQILLCNTKWPVWTSGVICYPLIIQVSDLSLDILKLRSAFSFISFVTLTSCGINQLILNNSLSCFTHCLLQSNDDESVPKTLSPINTMFGFIELSFDDSSSDGKVLGSMEIIRFRSSLQLYATRILVFYSSPLLSMKSLWFDTLAWIFE